MAGNQYDPNLNNPDQGGPYGSPQGGGGPYPPAGGSWGPQGGPYGGPGGPAGPGGPGGPYHGPGGPHHHPEKQDEKEQEKRQEKGGGMDEKYHRDPLRFFSWGLLIIWVGIILLLQNTDVIGRGDRGWGLFFWGWGALFLVESGIRLSNPRWRRPAMGSFIFGAAMIVVGFGLWFGNWNIVWPIVIIAVGISILAGRITRRR